MAIECLSAGILFADVACAPVERVPEAGELVPTERMQLSLGGCASNTALDLAKVGVQVGVSGCVGDDPFGRFIVDALSVDGIDTSGIHEVSGVGSAASLVINVRGQDRRFISTPAANTRFTVEHICEDWLSQARVMYVGGFFMMPLLETEALVEVFRKVRARGGKTVLDVVLYGDKNYWSRLEKILPETDFFMPNDDEGELITGLKDPVAQAERFCEAGAKNVVITCGSKGSYLIGEAGRLKSGIYPMEFVGGTGSGDAFDAGFIAGLLAGEDMPGCLRWGSSLGASCVRSITATESVFARPEAEAFMKGHELKIEAI
ncbi:MAG: carbohydrate kinase family protein [Thermoguttaceae bacterium]